LVIGNAGLGVNIAGLTVNGNGFSVNANEFMRVFYIAGTGSTSVVINDLTIKGGSITVISDFFPINHRRTYVNVVHLNRPE
jgi:hypothetical protein